MISCSRVERLPIDLDDLRGPAAAEGFRFVERLVSDFQNGEQRFDREGEALFELRLRDVLIGVGGVTRGLDQPQPHIGRLRRVYVHPHYRGIGAGRRLVRDIESHAWASFSRLTLRTHSDEASAFYLALGYQPVADHPTVTHDKARPPLG